jgi:TRAP-type transport system periplasmic protein
MHLRRSAIAAAILLDLAGAAPAPAQVTFELINEYPATSISGEADAFFAKAVRSRSGGRVVIVPVLNAKSGLRSRDQIKAVTDGAFAMADSFAGALGDDNPAFLLSTPPFLAPSIARANTLYAAARPIYDRLFAERRQKLLYVTPWPPSGIWSKGRITNAGLLKTLSIRTYDKTSTEVFAQVASSATLVSFSDLRPKLVSGEINAVLSSGDGGAGQHLWAYLPDFSDINYAVPLSFTAISIDVWNKLDEDDRTAIEIAARETMERQWTALITRVDENFARMRSNGIAVDESPPQDLFRALHAAAAAPIADWAKKVGPEEQRLLEEHLRRLGR